MTKNLLKIIGSIAIAGVFIWLAVRGVNLDEVWDQMQSVTLYWLPFFLVTMLGSHYLRAMRWRLLLLHEGKSIPRSTLFAGVMLGYVVNAVVPRLGEISRPVYVAKKQEMSTSNVLGTIVTERIFDLFTMLFLMFLAVIFLVSDASVVEEIFGVENWTWQTYMLIPVAGLFLIATIWLFYKTLVKLDRDADVKNVFIQKIINIGRSFGEGIVSIRSVKEWPLFLLQTAGIWGGYIVMTFLPFYMLNLQAEFGLYIKEAILLTMVSAVGISIPTPGGIGSYHLLIQQSMWLLYDVPLVTALTYATVAHAATVLLVLITGPLALWWDKYYTLKIGDAR